MERRDERSDVNSHAHELGRRDGSRMRPTADGLSDRVLHPSDRLATIGNNVRRSVLGHHSARDVAIVERAPGGLRTCESVSPRRASFVLGPGISSCSA